MVLIVLCFVLRYCYVSDPSFRNKPSFKLETLHQNYALHFCELAALNMQISSKHGAKNDSEGFSKCRLYCVEYSALPQASIFYL